MTSLNFFESYFVISLGRIKSARFPFRDRSSGFFFFPPPVLLREMFGVGARVYPDLDQASVSYLRVFSGQRFSGETVGSG